GRLDWIHFSGRLNESPQWLMKNCFFSGRKVSAVPMIGRRAVVICSTTSTNTMIQVFKPAEERACEWEQPACKKRSPKKTEMNQKTRCKTPIQRTDSVEVEKSHATGAKPMS